MDPVVAGSIAVAGGLDCRAAEGGAGFDVQPNTEKLKIRRHAQKLNGQEDNFFTKGIAKINRCGFRRARLVSGN